MHKKKEVSLKVEHFARGQDIEFRIKSTKEMLLILQDIAEKGTRVALYYDDNNNFILTTLHGANEDGMWLDVGPFPPENKRILLSNKITFVSLHNHVKVQFMAPKVVTTLLEGDEAFYLELPDYILRIQRRDYFRLSIPVSAPVSCLIPVKPFNPAKPDEPEVIREVPVLDISGCGISLLCDEHETELQPGKSFHDCLIHLPDTGTLRITIVIKNNVRFTGRDDLASVRAGCQIGHLDNEMKSLLQSYITRLQSEILTKGLSGDP